MCFLPQEVAYFFGEQSLLYIGKVQSCCLLQSFLGEFWEEQYIQYPKGIFTSIRSIQLGAAHKILVLITRAVNYGSVPSVFPW